MSDIVENMGRYTVDITSEVPVNIGHGFRSCKIGTRTGLVEISLDFAKLRQCAERALKNKNLRSQLANGGVKFRVKPGSVTEQRIEP